MKTVNEMQRTIKTLLRGMITGLLSPAKAAVRYKALESDYAEMLGTLPASDSPSYIRGLLYRHNVQNLSKATALFRIGSDVGHISFSGNRELMPILEDAARSITDSGPYGRVERIVLGSKKSKDIICFHFQFPVRDERFAVMTISSSRYFENNRFHLLCRTIEDLFRFTHSLTEPRIGDIRSMSFDAIQRIIAGHPPDTTAGIYSIPNIQQVLSHVSSPDFWEIHNTIAESLKENIPDESVLYPVSPFRYLVINDTTKKNKCSITIRGIIISFAVRQFNLGDPGGIYRMIWEL